MFFFIGGIQPKGVDLEEGKRMCPVCGLHTAQLRRLDHYLSLFFIPVLRVRKGEVFLECSRCGIVSPQAAEGYQGMRQDRCPRCNGEVSRQFRFCPFCGNRL